MDGPELRERGRQAARRYGERLLGLAQGELNDSAFRRRCGPGYDGASIDAVAAHVVDTMKGSDPARRPLLPFFGSRERGTSLLRRRFSRECDELIDRADRATAGRFDLLALSDLSFGDPIDWHLEPTSGKRTGAVHWSTIDYLDPSVAGDKKVTWELNRHGHFVTLGQAYVLTGNERYAEAFAAQVLSWLDANPPRRGINWASSLEASFRSIAWIWALHCFAPSSRLTPSIIWRIIKSLLEHGRYIESYLSYYFAPNTHLTGEALGLLYLGTVFPWLADAARWRRLGLDILLDRLPKQIQADGVYFEQSSYYHRYTADFALHLMLLTRAADMALPALISDAAAGLFDHLLWITRPDGRSTLYGDEDGGRLLSLHRRDIGDCRDTLQAGAVLYGNGAWKWASGTAGPELLWLLGPEKLDAYDRMPAMPPGGLARRFSASGLVVLRDGWSSTSSYVFVDGGRHGAANYVHAHADALSFEYAAAGVTWIVDPGTYTYTKQAEWRDYFRGSRAHNTLVVEGLPQSVPDGPFSWRQVAHATILRFEEREGDALCEAEQDGYERLTPSVRHRRTFHLLKRHDDPGAPAYLLIRDRVVTAGRYRCHVRFHLAPDCIPTRQDETLFVSHSSGTQLAVGIWRIDPDGAALPAPINVEDGWVSRGYGQREPAHVLTAEMPRDGSRGFVTVLVPVVKGQDLHLESLALPRQGQESFARSALRAFKTNGF